MRTVAPKRPQRRFSKVLVGGNIVLCWLLIFYAVYARQADVAVAALAIIATIVGAYVGVGHMDYRSVLNAMKGVTEYGAFDQGSSINIDNSGQDQ